MKINDYILFDHLLDVFNYEAGLGEKSIWFVKIKKINESEKWLDILINIFISFFKFSRILLCTVPTEHCTLYSIFTFNNGRFKSSYLNLEK